MKRKKNTTLLYQWANGRHGKISVETPLLGDIYKSLKEHTGIFNILVECADKTRMTYQDYVKVYGGLVVKAQP